MTAKLLTTICDCFRPSKADAVDAADDAADEAFVEDAAIADAETDDSIGAKENNNQRKRTRVSPAKAEETREADKVGGEAEMKMENGEGLADADADALLSALRADRSVGFSVVHSFLKSFPECLEDFVYNHVGVEDLERLLIRKTHRQTQFLGADEGNAETTPESDAAERRRDAGDASADAATPTSVKSASRSRLLVDGTVHTHRSLTQTDVATIVNGGDKKRLSLSRWKFCVHADKRKMLQQLTKEITDYHNKVRVLVELSDCISSAVNADGYHLYFLNDSKDTLHRWSAEQLVAAAAAAASSSSAAAAPSATDLHLPVASGTTVPAFVAATKQTVLLKKLDDVRRDGRFPEGVGGGANVTEWATSVLCQPIFQSDGELIGVLELLRGRGGAAGEASAAPTLGRTESTASENVFVDGPGAGSVSAPSAASTSTAPLTPDFKLREEPFAEEDEEITGSYLVWGGIAMYYAEMYVGLKKSRNLNEFLLDVIKSLFKDISTDKVVSRIMAYAKRLVDADRASLFMVDAKQEELYAHVFDQGDIYVDGDFVPNTKPEEIRFPKDKGIAGHVATTGETLNIPDVYADPRFNRDVDAMTGYRTRTILCMPIRTRDAVIGVVQLVNKRGGAFTKKDEAAFQVFAVYCGLALHNAGLYDRLWKSEQRYKVANEIMSYHYKCTDEEVDRIRRLPPHPIHFVKGFNRFDFFGWHIHSDVKVQHVVEMFYELFDRATSSASASRASTPSSVDAAGATTPATPATTPLGVVLKSSERWSSTSHSGGTARLYIDKEQILNFLLTVRKNYRQIPYHNWNHAFEVARAMFCLLKSQHRFSMLEGVGLFIGCLCHDVDHRGKTNSFMVKSSSPLSLLHTTSTLEHHHFKHTVSILQQDRHNIFERFKPDEYKDVLRVIKHCILATDLVQFFKNKPLLENLAETQGGFDWDSPTHRDLLMAVGMTACDLSSGYTEWEGSRHLASKLMEEFWQQGDEERLQGLTPIEQIEPILDRRQENNLPVLEVQFITNVCLPCYRVLSRVVPEAEEMVAGAETNLAHWRALAADLDKWRDMAPRASDAPCGSGGRGVKEEEAADETG